MSQPYVTGIELNGDNSLISSVLLKQTNDLTINGLSFEPTIVKFSVSGGFMVYSDFTIVSATPNKIVCTFSAQGLMTSGQSFDLNVFVYNGKVRKIAHVTVS